MRKLSILFLSALAVCACSSSSTKQTTQAKQLYIKDGEYQAANKSSVQGERRAAPPIIESDYIFRIQPQETFYFDEKDMPLTGAAPAPKAADKAATGGPMKRPKRYMSGGSSAQPDTSAAQTDTSAAAPQPQPDDSSQDSSSDDDSM
ncbi:MAG: hypothetical protein FWF35_03260 [Elusimicrobia bacterium]|nr:hypothetical protein [Elusimicrobiota bacterium]